MKRSIAKKIISFLIAVTLLLNSTVFGNLNAFADFRDAVMTGFAEVSNYITDRASVYSEECSHKNIEITNRSTATCIRKAYVTYTCPDCGYTRRSYEALGHFYVCDSEEYRAFRYKCNVCGVMASYNTDTALDKFREYMLKAPKRNNDNCFLDVVSDGIINGKDFAKLKLNNEYTLTNPNADEKTKRIYKYLCDVYNNQHKTLSAQQESTWMGSVDYEIDYIHRATGKYPAMRGLDYMNDDFYGVNQRAIDYFNKGGLVTICWHTGSDFTGEWNDAMGDVVSDWTQMLTQGTPEYNSMIAGMDKAARALLELQNKGVTVLWRPFHEFDGGWFWWGKGTAQNFKDMWRIMYDRYTNYWGLNNLIWVLGFSHNVTLSNSNFAVWNPGEDYYDIIGADTYDPSEFPTLYTKIKSISANGKPLVLHECGTNPNVSELTASPYGYFMTWHTEYLTDTNDNDSLRLLYNSEQVITLDEVSY